MILLLNPDTVVDPDTVEVCGQFLAATPRAGIVGCGLRNADGERVVSSRRFPTLWDYFTENLGFRRSLGSPLPNSTAKTDDPTPVDMVVGAFFMVKRKVIEQIGQLDEQFFIYAEERDYCMRANDAGWHVYLLQSVSAMHVGGSSTDWHPDAMFIERLRSTLLLHGKHNTWLFRSSVWLILLIGAAIRSLYWSIRSVVHPSTEHTTKRKIYSAGFYWLVSHGGKVVPRPAGEIGP